MTGVVVVQEAALQRAAGMLHDRQLFAVQLPGSDSHSHQQCTEAFEFTYLTASAENAVLAQEHLKLCVAGCNQDEQ